MLEDRLCSFQSPAGSYEGGPEGRMPEGPAGLLWGARTEILSKRRWRW
jgi:hypothetical protein